MFAYQGFNSLQKHNKKAEEEEEERAEMVVGDIKQKEPTIIDP